MATYRRAAERGVAWMDTSPSAVGLDDILDIVSADDIVGMILSVNFSQLTSCSSSGSTLVP
jgi:hypothetical protein